MRFRVSNWKSLQPEGILESHSFLTRCSYNYPRSGKNEETFESAIACFRGRSGELIERDAKLVDSSFPNKQECSPCLLNQTRAEPEWQSRFGLSFSLPHKQTTFHSWHTFYIYDSMRFSFYEEPAFLHLLPTLSKDARKPLLLP